ncbi:Retrovirus-related Pol polyprotein [Thelohanellus kitauei]|uniref:Retrovirus-related Pol polyprotein n=1 Tax=Thelohanellus kitauei TaxID=669202 RepID=A0A0C2NCJ2_THEKT|nr:Retrovirus-related Pol polyprotein [Thelohanellus kitauei]
MEISQWKEDQRKVFQITEPYYAINTIEDFFKKYFSLFYENSKKYGKTNVLQHQIETTAHSPIKQPKRRLPLMIKYQVELMVQDLLKEGIIEKSISPWSSNLVVVKKKDGSKILCIDYRILNSVTIKNAFILPRKNEILDALKRIKSFSTIDLFSGYYQI